MAPLAARRDRAGLCAAAAVVAALVVLVAAGAPRRRRGRARARRRGSPRSPRWPSSPGLARDARPVDSGAHGAGSSGRARPSARDRRRRDRSRRRGRRALRATTCSSCTAGSSCCAPTTSARSSTTARAGSGRTRSSGTTRRCRSARCSRSSARTGSSRATASRRSGCCAGCRPSTVLSWWRGHPAGWWNPADWNVASICVPIATHVPHAAGLAWGKKLRGETACAIAYFGDGATSEGAFHEGANFAAVMRAPLVLFCNNNQWAISTPLSAQTAAETLADKAVGYGMPGVRVDGGDVLAVYEATREAVERARAGDGPTLHRGGHLPRRAARDRRRPDRVHRPRARRGGEAARVRRPLRGLPAPARAAHRRGRRGGPRGGGRR